MNTAVNKTVQHAPAPDLCGNEAAHVRTNYYMHLSTEDNVNNDTTVGGSNQMHNHDNRNVWTDLLMPTRPEDESDVGKNGSILLIGASTTPERLLHAQEAPFEFIGVTLPDFCSEPSGLMPNAIWQGPGQSNTDGPANLIDNLGIDQELITGNDSAQANTALR